jgi:hypothetical protein
MFYQVKTLALASFALIAIVGCADTSHKVTQTDKQTTASSYMTNTTAREAEAQNYVEIGFTHGSAMLNDSAKTSLNSIIKQARQDGKIDQVVVLSWSDEEYPSKNVKALPKSQRELAAKRNKNIEKYVRTVRDVDVNTFNMAERPSTFSKLFNTDDTKLKESLVSAGLSTTADTADYVNKASRSVILIKVK